MRISDWSSYVCSSDLCATQTPAPATKPTASAATASSPRATSPCCSANARLTRSILPCAPVSAPTPNVVGYPARDHRRREIALHWMPSRKCRRAVEIGRAHVRTPVTNAHLVCRLLLEKKKKETKNKIHAYTSKQ